MDNEPELAPVELRALRILKAIGRLQDATAGTAHQEVVDELLMLLAADTTVVELRQELELAKAKIGQLERQLPEGRHDG